jgi:DNA-binding IclR family transcriptional regulator
VTKDDTEQIGQRGGLSGSARVLAVLRQLAEHPGGLRLGEIATTLQVPKSSAHRAAGVLVGSGFARQDVQGTYHLGFDLLRLVFSYHEAYAPQLMVGQVLQRMSDATGEACHYGVLIGGDITYQAKVSPSRGTLQMSSVIGGSNPAYRTGIGKALLMHQLPDLAAVRDYVERYGPLQARTKNTITSAQKLHKALQEGRRTGYTVDLEENELGIVCVAFPIFLDSPARPTGAISVSAVSGRTSIDKLVDRLPELRQIIIDELGADVLTWEGTIS